MSNELEDKLNYLVETKNQIKQAINLLDGNIVEDHAFSIYPDKIQDIISVNIIPQSTLDEFVEKIIDINN